jgi:hypothetical protein
MCDTVRCVTMLYVCGTWNCTILINCAFFSRCCNTADKKCQDLHGKIESGVTAIRSTNEYSAFIDANKTSPPPALPFKFEQALTQQGGKRWS